MFLLLGLAAGWAHQKYHEAFEVATLALPSIACRTAVLAFAYVRPPGQQNRSSHYRVACACCTRQTLARVPTKGLHAQSHGSFNVHTVAALQQWPTCVLRSSLPTFWPAYMPAAADRLAFTHKQPPKRPVSPLGQSAACLPAGLPALRAGQNPLRPAWQGCASGLLATQCSDCAATCCVTYTHVSLTHVEGEEQCTPCTSHGTQNPLDGLHAISPSASCHMRSCTCSPVQKPQDMGHDLYDPGPANQLPRRPPLCHANRISTMPHKASGPCPEPHLMHMVLRDGLRAM